MARNKQYLICYDIREPKRLKRVHKCITSYSFSMQYSVFYAQISEFELQKCIRELEEIIDKSVDDVRIYKISSVENAILVGQNSIGETLSKTHIFI